MTGLFIITFVVQAFEIPSSSMENTLLIGDHVFVNRIQFAPKSSWIGPLLPYRDPRFRDIVVFLSPAEPGTLRGEANHRVARRPDSLAQRGGLSQRRGPGRALRVHDEIRWILTAIIFQRCRPTMIPM